MTKRRFKMTPGAWRLLGLVLMLLGIFLMILLPTSQHPDAVIYRGFNDKGQVTRLFSVWHGMILVGVLALYPTLKGWTISMFGKKKKPDEPNNPTP